MARISTSRCWAWAAFLRFLPFLPFLPVPVVVAAVAAVLPVAAAAALPVAAPPWVTAIQLPKLPAVLKATKQVLPLPPVQVVPAGIWTVICWLPVPWGAYICNMVNDISFPRARLGTYSITVLGHGGGNKVLASASSVNLSSHLTGSITATDR